tara:strand:+ start:214 stop:336 length:123 start_codon:yes stop_codon:yes gene_type:complete
MDQQVLQEIQMVEVLVVVLVQLVLLQGHLVLVVKEVLVLL